MKISSCRHKRQGLRGLKIRIFLILLPLLISTPAVSQSITIRCEVLDAGGPAIGKTTKDLCNIRYLLLHHADVQRQGLLSQCLKQYSGREVTFSVNNRDYRGVIYRLPHCFGRGLLLYNNNIEINKKEIITIQFPNYQRSTK